MKRSLLAFLFPALLAAQTVTVGAPTAVKAGNSLALTVGMYGTGGQVAAVQWTFNFPSGLALGMSAISAADGAAGKAVTCGAAICVVVGDNANTMPDGTLATVLIPIPKGTTGKLKFWLSGVVAASPQGYNVAITGGKAVTVKIKS